MAETAAVVVAAAAAGGATKTGSAGHSLLCCDDKITQLQAPTFIYKLNYIYIFIYIETRKLGAVMFQTRTSPSSPNRLGSERRKLVCAVLFLLVVVSLAMVSPDAEPVQQLHR